MLDWLMTTLPPNPILGAPEGGRDTGGKVTTGFVFGVTFCPGPGTAPCWPDSGVKDQVGDGTDELEPFLATTNHEYVTPLARGAPGV
jgi:hypothetical protein